MKPEIKKLLQKGDRALKAAKGLLDQGDADFSVSRAYYAMFYAAEALLLTKHLVSSKHGGVLQLLFEHFVQPGLMDRSLHQDLHRLFDLRQEGDYWTESSITPETAGEALETARKFVSTVAGMIAKG